MATLVATTIALSNNQKFQILVGKLVASGTYVAGGIALDSVLEALADVHSGGTGPVWIDIQSVSGSGYTYQHIASTGKMMILVGGAVISLPQAELAAGALPAGVTADIINFRAEFIRNAA